MLFVFSKLICVTATVVDDVQFPVKFSILISAVAVKLFNWLFEWWWPFTNEVCDEEGEVEDSSDV